ncbi:MAG: cytochrome c peroxidase [Schlesneria sp.]
MLHRGNISFSDDFDELQTNLFFRRVVINSIRLNGFIAIFLAGLQFATSLGGASELAPIEQLGKRLFFDSNLSTPAGQSCASCHAPEAGFTGPSSDVNLKTGVYPGAAPGRFGNRKPPTIAYSSFSPKRSYQQNDETWLGGHFWDGRADDLVAQAKGPLLNPLEMNNASAADVVSKVRKGGYQTLFVRVFGPGSLEPGKEEKTFDQIAQAIAAYESSHEVNAFRSKYDAYLAKRAVLTSQEMRGLQLFAGRANCSACHPHEPGADGSAPLFTDFTYDNLGVPRNEANPFYVAQASVNSDGRRYQDLGLGGVLKDESQFGKVKVPTLRNVAKKPYPDFVKSYLHNGTFKSLKEVVHFYNKRDQEPDEFPPADVPATVNHNELGSLGLSDAEEDDLIAFLETLSDETEPTSLPQPRWSSTSKNSFRNVRDILRVERFRQNVIQASGRSDTSIR